MTTKRKLIYAGVGAALLIAFFIFKGNQKPKLEYNTAAAVQADLEQTVSETGTIKPDKELELNFAASGKIALINVKVGDKVSSSAILAELVKSDLAIRLKEASASLSVSRARLSKLLSGASAEDKAVAQANYDAAVKDLASTDLKTKEAVAQAEKDNQDLSSGQTGGSQSVSQAQTNLANAKKTYQKAIDNKRSSLVTALQTKLPTASTGADAVNRYLNDISIASSFSKKNSSYLSLTTDSYNSSKNSIKLAQTALTSLSASDDNNLDANYNNVIKALNDTATALNYCFAALESSIISSEFPQSSIDTAKSVISAQQSAVTTAINSLESAHQALNDAELAYESNVNAASAALSEAMTKTANALTNARSSREQLMSASQARLAVAEAQLKKTLAPARVEDIMLEQAQVRQAEASVDLISNQISNNQIIAPSEGIITKIANQIGEQTTPAQPVIFMIADNNFSIDIDVSETDISKLKVGNQASIYLDAFGEDVKFDGLVNFIEPAETVIQGVTYYKVKISFTPDAGREIKSGMTATAKISTDRRSNVVIIPERAVIDQDNFKIVKTLDGDIVTEHRVTLGMSGDNGLVEVLSGIKSGDQVITSTKTTSK